MSAGCTAALRGGILTLTLDTPGSSVNVFTPAIALELERELARGLAKGARAVVLRSAKPGSFVNGVGLLLAASSHSREGAMERARTLQRCYEALAAAPVPTIAEIAGNCYGCGLELALTCDYRIAQDSYDTHFYMPELRDYAFIPLFGGTQRLPRLLGLPQAMRVLVGERIDAREALRIGLIDRIGEATAEMLAKKPRRTAKKRDGAVDLSVLPAPERPLAKEALRLARLTVRPGYRLQDGLRAELASFWETVGSKESQRAMSFFFVRQAAKVHAIGSAAYQLPKRVAVRFDTSARPLERLVRARLPQARIAAGPLTIAQRPPGDGFDCAAYLPFPQEPVPPVELAVGEMPWPAGAPLFQLLEQAGFAPVVTRARGRFVSERMLEAFRKAAPSPSALLQFGFRLPRPLERQLAKARGKVEPAIDAVAQEALRALDSGELQHPTQADLLAHLLLGFPVVHGGLLRYVKAGRPGVLR